MDLRAIQHALCASFLPMIPLPVAVVEAALVAAAMALVGPAHALAPGRLAARRAAVQAPAIP